MDLRYSHRDRTRDSGERRGDSYVPPVSDPPQASTLIPHYVMDPASQRLLIVSIFVAIQCMKLYEILLVKADTFAVVSSSSDGNGSAFSSTNFTSMNNFTFVLKYALVDGVFLWFLPVLNIPLLTFSPVATLFLTLVVNSFNFLLTSNFAMPLLSSVFLPIWNAVYKNKELTLVGDSAVPRNVIDVNSHFKGRYTVQYLPESSVMLNPFSFSSLCLEASDSGSSLFSSSLRLPVQFNTTNDVGSMMIQHTAPDGSMHLLNYTRNEIRKLAKRDYSHYSQYPEYVSNDERVFYLDVEIKDPGSYRIDRVTDSEGMVIRPFKSVFNIGHCPTAGFVYPESKDVYSNYRCIGKNADDTPWHVPLIASFGVLPLSVEFSSYKNGRKMATFNKTVVENEPRRGVQSLQSQTISRNFLERLILQDPSKFQDSGPGTLSFRVLSVCDSFGNRRFYNPESNDPDVSFSMLLRDSPSLSLCDLNPARKLLLDSSKALHLETSGKVSFPLSVSLNFKSDDSEHSQLLNFTFATEEQLASGIKITQPGTYSLENADDEFCPCHVKDKTPITITRPSPPSVKIKETPILDKCVGTVGFEFDLSFKGEGPFEVKYEVFKNSSRLLRPVLSERGLKQHSISSPKKSFSFQYKPAQEGNYVLKYKVIHDHNYKDVQISGTNVEFSTYINKRSKYSLFKEGEAKTKSVSLCRGGQVDIPVHFQGNFPFSFKYDIVDTATNKAIFSDKVSGFYQDVFNIKSPKFSSGGEYKVVLRDVLDNLGCQAETSVSERITIKARKDAPSVQFKKSEIWHIVEGDSIKLPIKVTSDVATTSRDEIEYEKVDLLNKTKTESFLLRGKSEITVKEQGIYKLKSFKSDGCAGTIKNQEHTMTVKFYPRPNVTLITEPQQVIGETTSDLITLKSLCQDEPQHIKLRFEGKKPFVLGYTIKYPSGKVKSSHLQVDSSEITLPMTTRHGGRYEHQITEVFDSLYTIDKLSKLPHKVSIPRVVYDVNVAPSLAVQNQYLQVCEMMISNDFSFEVPIEFVGLPPFQVSGVITSGNKAVPFTVEEISGNSIKLGELKTKQSLKQVFSVGEHKIKFNTISDFNGCQRQNLVDNNLVMVSVTKLPSIQKHHAKDYYCVGDHISYNMSGISPFVVFYKFNEKDRKAESGPVFSRLASKPGELAIVALQDSSANSCVVDYTKDEAAYNKLKLQVHDLPSVEISQGDSIIKNIHEGDQTEITFKFIGTPPFSVTYVRTLGAEKGQHKRRQSSKSKGPRRVVDTKSVSDIWDYEHSEIVSLEGTYEAIQVSDAFCKASRDVKDLL